MELGCILVSVLSVYSGFPLEAPYKLAIVLIKW